MKNIDETRNYFTEEINQNELKSKKHKKVSRNLNYINHLLIFAFVPTGCASISVFASLVGIPICVTSSAVKLIICAITARIKKSKLIIKKKKKHDKIVLLAKTKLSTIEVLISRALSNSYISHDELVLVNVLREYDEIQYLKTSIIHQRF